MKMSPFMHADKVKKPLLLIHGKEGGWPAAVAVHPICSHLTPVSEGEDDNNTGTFPMQSERYYAALKGHGATTRLVILPHESHGYRARESILHCLYEMDTWLDKYCKNGGQHEDRQASTAGAAPEVARSKL